jgi:hypothetical protein
MMMMTIGVGRLCPPLREMERMATGIAMWMVPTLLLELY